MLLEKEESVYDAALSWGAKASDYDSLIMNAIESSKTPVCIELNPDIEDSHIIYVDHHNKRAGEPASILQVCKLLGVEPTRWQQLVAANDSDYIPGMRRLGASLDEIQKIRLMDRQYQGISSEQEAEAQRAVSVAHNYGKLCVVKCHHNKTAPICDRLNASIAPENILILSDCGESNFFGSEQAIQELVKSIPDFTTWYGKTYWGSVDMNQCELERVCIEKFS